MKTKNRIQTMVRIALFGAMATILYVVPIFKFALPIFPSFLEIHIDEIPALIAGFSYGPFVAVGVLFIKTLIKLPFSTSLCVGELADLIYSLCLVLPPAILFKKFKTKKSLIFGAIIGVVSQLFVSFFVNIFVMFPFYCFVYGFTMQQIYEICNALNSLVVDQSWTIGLFIVLPFNLIKNAIVVVGTTLITFPLYLYIYKEIKKS